MKCFIIIVGYLIAASLQDKIEEPYDCYAKLGPEKLLELPDDIYGSEPLAEDNSALNELMGCIFKSNGFIDEQGVINVARLEKYFVDSVLMLVESEGGQVENGIHGLVQSCMSLRGYNYGQTAVKVQNCMKSYINIQRKRAASKRAKYEF